MHQITPIPAFNDNYIWAIGHPGNNALVVVDPGDAKPVIDYIESGTSQLAAILLTHHHPDHVGGVKELIKYSPAPVYGPAKESLPHCDHPLSDGDDMYLADIEMSLKVYDIPGHTAGHIALYNDQTLFSGDTLFAAGCGRLFEGTPEQMHHSLSRLAALNPNTHVYCGHEYTLANLAFAETVEPNNHAIKQRIVICKEKRELGMPTLPSTIAQELETNPFMRCDQADVKQAAETHSGKTLNSAVEVFAAVRQWKDSF
ncbi:MAG: hydroxyacylglutathione hydrolase [Coxiellaceae bacterium]|nr:hydroxyacylglutathione hydrolase [Coxiellaceae bacterium]